MADEGEAQPGIVEHQADAPAAPPAEPRKVQSAEDVAALMGWKPKEQFRGTGDWIPAEEFLTQFPEVLRGQRQKTKAAQEKLDRLSAHVERISQQMTTRQAREFDSRLEAAAEAGDVDQIKKIMKEAKEGGEPSAPAENPAFTAFKEKADWFGVHPAATDYAAVVGRRLAKQGRGEDDGTYADITKEVLRRFPELAEDAPPTPRARSEPPPVGRGGRVSATTPKAVTAADLSPEELKAATRMGVKPEDWAASKTKMNRQNAEAVQ